jgi:D-arginine dehydrogenase
MARQRIIVVGAGMAGASIAALLAAEADVILVEAEESAGYHTTGRSAAMYLPDYGNAPVRALTRASRDFLAAPPAGFAEHDLLSRRGLLILADADNLGLLDAPPYDRLERLTADAALALVPLLRRDAFVAARHDPDAASIDVDLLHHGYLRLGKARGVTMLLGHRIVAASHAGRQWRVTTAGGPVLAADLVINAAGAWADEVAAIFGARPLGLSPRQRTMVLLDPPEGVAVDAWPFVLTVQESLYFKPDAGKLALSPADETEVPPGDAQPEELDVAIAIDRFQALVDMPVRRITHSWAGLRTFAADRTPVIGPDPEAPGFFWFAGQGGYGIQMAPAAADLGAALASGKPVPRAIEEAGVDAETVSPARFQVLGAR